jgi:hypothetical protein
MIICYFRPKYFAPASAFESYGLLASHFRCYICSS